MKNNLVTIFLVTYNHFDTIENSIKSVLEQVTTFSYKLVILDDASTDGTSDIVRKYAKDYPQKIIPIIRNHNIGEQLNFYNGLKTVDTKYYTVLEGDDYWCDKQKLQTQIEILEQNPDCSFCAHNTLVKYLQDDIERPYIKSKTQKYGFPPKRITKKYYIEPHTSSRVYRTKCLNLKEIQNPIVATYDIATNFYFLTKGNLFYIDKIMSVYNYTENGVYSGLNPYTQRFKSANIINLLNKEFNYKYNKILSRLFSTRLNLNFCTYLKIKYLKQNFEATYSKILDKYKNQYLINADIKPIFKFKFPIGAKKWLSLELKREKVRG